MFIINFYLNMFRASYSSHTTSRNASFTTFVYILTDVERDFLTTTSVFYDITQYNIQYFTCRYIVMIGGTLNIYIGAKRCGFTCEGLPRGTYFCVTGKLIVVAEKCPGKFNKCSCRYL